MSSFHEDAATAENPPTSRDWEAMLAEFRALGGVAENIVLRRAPSVQRLYSEDPAMPFLVRVPKTMAFPVREIEFVGEMIRVRNGAVTNATERDFFERYQTAYSWGGGGRSEAARLIDMFATLPAGLRATLAADFGMEDQLEGNRAERILRQFLRSRAIDRDRNNLLIPIIEFARRGGGGVACASDERGNLQIQGIAHGEISIPFGPHDTLGVFRKFGIASARPHAFSLPMKTKIGTSDLTIGRDLTAKTERARFGLPETKLESGELFLSHLMVGNSHFPRGSRGIFDTLVREARMRGSAEAFDLVLHLNKETFLHLLELLEPLRGEMITRLRRMALFQLEAMTYCIGTREI
jgi:hypothetical protein